MFDWFKYAEIESPKTRDEAKALLEQGYGLMYDQSDYESFIMVRESDAAGNAVWGMRHSYAGGSTVGYVQPAHENADALIDYAENIAGDVKMWHVIEETGEPGNIPTYGGVCW